MKRTLLPFAFAALSTALTGTVALAADDPYGPMSGGMSIEESHELAKKYPPTAWNLANTCSGCHGTNGAEFKDIIPPLAGMNKTAFIQMMQRFKKGDNHDFIVMGIVAKPLTDEEIEKMADYFSKQKPVEWTQPDWRKDVKDPAKMGKE